VCILAPGTDAAGGHCIAGCGCARDRGNRCHDALQGGEPPDGADRERYANIEAQYLAPDLALATWHVRYDMRAITRIHEESLDPDFAEFARRQNPYYDKQVTADKAIAARRAGPQRPTAPAASAP
jgi:hypothetical protein